MGLEDILYRRSKIFKHEERLQVDYVPTYLPHREQQLKMLALMFTPLINEPGSTSQKIILTGRVGTGKTAVAKYFGREIRKIGDRRNIKINYVHVNCHKNRSLFLLMRKTARDLRLPVPPRGFSSQELVGIVSNMLEERDEYLLLTLDEADYLIRATDGDALYNLSRISDESIHEHKRVNFIFIMRDLSAMYLLDDSIRSTLQHNIIRFDPYTSSQICDILWARVTEEEALYPEAIGEGVIEHISDLVGYEKGGKGDARLALETLWRAGKYAEAEGAERINIEHVRKAYSDSLIATSADIGALRLHEAILLLAITKVLKMTGLRRVKLGDAEKMYEILCEQLGETPRGHTKIWEYVQSLRNMGIIGAERSGKGMRGKSTLIEIPTIPLETLEKMLWEHLKGLKEGGSRRHNVF